MFNDPINPYGTEDYEDDSIPPEEPPLIPGGEGYWRLIDGIWRWMTEPTSNTAVS
jgi:hypothetical protein